MSASRTLSAAQREQRRAAIQKRWGPPRVIRLDDLAPEQRAFIAELVDVARRNAKATREPAA